MKTFLCILAVASVANATLNLGGLFGGGGSGGGSRGRVRSSSSSGSSSSGLNLGAGLEGIGEGIQGLTSLLGGKGPIISTQHQLDHNVNVVHHYEPSQNGGGGGGEDVHHHIIEDNGGWGGQNSYADQHQEVRVIKVIHEESAPSYHSHHDHDSSGGHVQIVKVVHQHQAPELSGW